MECGIGRDERLAISGDNIKVKRVGLLARGKLVERKGNVERPAYILGKRLPCHDRVVIRTRD